MNSRENADNNIYLQCTIVGPDSLIFVYLTLLRKFTIAEENLGTPLSGQAVKWNW